VHHDMKRPLPHNFVLAVDGISAIGLRRPLEGVVANSRLSPVRGAETSGGVLALISRERFWGSVRYKGEPVKPHADASARAVPPHP